MSMPRSRVSRKNHSPIELNHKLDHKLLGYAASASAAGVAMIALAQPSRAEIVYTPTYRPIGQGGSVTLDFIHNGKTDFTIHSSFATCTFVESHCWFQQLVVIPSGQNHVLATYGEFAFARVLSSGAKIGWPAQFSSGKFGYVRMDRCKATQTSYYLSGSWPRERNRYLGLEFTIEGKVHFGWARLSLPIEAGLKCHAFPVLTGYAYETEPGKPILAGATSDIKKASQAGHAESTLGLLALGNAGMEAWRRDEAAAGTPDQH
jgi:hypothetical protein